MLDPNQDRFSLSRFRRADFEQSATIDGNHLICEQCFCYVCDKLASLVCGTARPTNARLIVGRTAAVASP